MIVKNLLQIITLRSAAISARRKQQLMLTTFVLVVVLAVRALKSEYLLGTFYTGKVLSVITYTLVFNITINVLRILIVSNHRKRKNIPNDERDNFTVGLNAIVNATTGFVTVLFTFVIFDIEFRSFLSSIALFAVALTIIFQDFIKNFLFGFAIMFTADYEIGNYIQVGSMPKGVILNITFSNVQLKTESGDILYIPNTVMRDNEIVNFSKLKPKRINVDFAVLRSQVSQIDEFEQALFTYLKLTHPSILELEKCKLYVRDTNKDEVLFTLEAFTKKASLKLKEQINHSVQKFSVEYHPDIASASII
jgi:small-conductance mechanosensitive channel